MQAKNSSYRKTLILSFVAGAAMLVIAYAVKQWAPGLLPVAVGGLLFVLAIVAAIVLLLVALAGLLVEVRDGRRERGEADLFLAANHSRSEDALRDSSTPVSLPFATLRRWLGAPQFVVGERVRVRTLQEIAATLDARGCLDGLPFMPEMARFCGKVGIVYRCVDKVYDYGGKKELRRMHETVLITGLRCDGAAHDGCQAGCYMLWKTAWLARASSAVAPDRTAAAEGAAPSVKYPVAAAVVDEPGASERRYFCQYTEIVRASSPMSSRDWRQDLRPLIAGNLTLTAFLVAMLTRLFNTAQRMRGGTGYPQLEATARTPLPPVNLGLQPGETVRVAPPPKIFETLNQKTGKNLGLWFDRDMLKNCLLEYKVLRRVDKIIDDASQRMIRMKTACIVLDTTDSSGEFLRFNAQSDPAFWREAWLERVEPAPQAMPPTEAKTHSVESASN